MTAPEQEGYDGAARLFRGEDSVEVTVSLRGVFQPIDGHYRWYGRIDAADGVAELAASNDPVMLKTTGGRAEGRLSDLDPWGRYRIAGTGRPPFRIPDRGRDPEAE